MVHGDSFVRGRLLILIVSVFAFAAKAAAATWHVAPGGTGDGASRENAWGTLAAIDQARVSAGDVVLIHAGTYSERLAITKSGESATRRITFKGVGQPVIRGINGGTQSHIAVIGLQFVHTSAAHNYAAIRLAGGNGWLIQDNIFRSTYRGGVTAEFGTVNSQHIIRANTFEDISSLDGGVASAPVVELYGDFNLVEYNTVRQGLDRTRAFGRGNVIRNNFFGATDTAAYPRTSPFPHHTDAFQSYNSSRVLTQLLYERNWDEDNRDSVGNTNSHGFLIQDDAGAGMNWAIARFNVLIRPGGTAYQFRGFERFYGYNLTSIAVQNGAPNLFRSAVTFDSGRPSNLHDWRNNTWSNCPRCIDNSGIITTANRPDNFTSDYQHAFNYSGTQGRLPTAANNLPAVDPLFVNSSTDDYRLQAGSPLRGAGGALTTATNAGSSSTALTVADARRIFDGWGIADGDLVRVGSGEYVRVASINYAANTITLAAPRTWSANDAVIVKGMEDIGALPFAYAVPIRLTNTTPISLPAGTVSLSATVENSSAVRMVEFLVDGLPVGIDYDAPYAVSWQADGAAHDVEARAYNAWAGRSLSVRRINTAPVFQNQPASQTVPPDTSVTFSANATAPQSPTFQWRRNGVALSDSPNISGATTSTLTLRRVNAADAGTYTLVATNSVDSTESDAATLSVTLSRLSNVSVRSPAGTGAQTLIVGFSVAGAGQKSLLLRGIGPTLASFGVTGVAANPQLRLFNSASTQINENDDWGGSPQLIGAFSALNAFSLPTNSRDAALLVGLAGGTYSAQLSDSAGTGVALVEVYDRDESPVVTRLSNLSVRSAVGTGADILIVGFTITGDLPVTLLIRAIGPTLATFGVQQPLSDPQLRIYNANNALTHENDNWGGASDLASAFTATGAFALPATSRDSAMIVGLPPGRYTAHVSGAASGTGVALVELYEVL